MVLGELSLNGLNSPERRKRSTQPRVAFIVMGSQGDNQPFAPLCQAIAKRGCAVELWGYGEKTVNWMRTLGVDAKLIEGSPDTEDMLRNPIMEEAMATGDMGTMMKVASQHIDPLQPKMWDSLLGHCRRFKPTVVCYSNLLQSTARTLRDLFGCTVVFTQLYPRSPTAHEPPVFMAQSGITLPCGGNHLLHKLVLGKLHGPALASDSELQKRRAAAGLAPPTLDAVHELFHSQPVVSGWSPAVFDGYDDMPGKAMGYWTLSDDAQLKAFSPSAELRAFLGAGPPPVYIGWGSMIAKGRGFASSAQFMTALAVEAAMLANVRVVVLAGWAQLGVEHLPEERADLRAFCELPGQVHFESGKVPHGWLLPQCASAVIHGGAGTTAAVLKAGIPCIITPCLVNDQPWWGKRVEKLGVGVGVKKQLRETTPADMAAAIGQVDETMRTAAAALSERINAEDGAGNAAAAIAEIVASAPPTRYLEAEALV